MNADIQISADDLQGIKAKLKFGTLCAEAYRVLILLTQKKFTT
ncbi:MAG: hypothetical protein QGF14_11130 [SAR324 cluster bacterium]|jgi:hypothetical protein|nr:hypothetical protein [SAR324 cluster bacterium]